MKDSKLNRDILFNLKRYLKKEAIFDFVANIPFIFYMPVVGIDFDISDVD